MEPLKRKLMYSYYFEDPIEKKLTRELLKARLEYYYLHKPIKIELGSNQVSTICLLKGQATLIRNNKKYPVNQFDMIFLPKNEQIKVVSNTYKQFSTKICSITTPILNDLGELAAPTFEIQHFSPDKFIPRGELGDTTKMATLRKVWTAFKNGYFMAGFTEIPSEARAQGVVTSVNIEKKNEKTFIFPHIHSEFPEVYIFCIDDISGSVAVSQFLINQNGQSVVKDLMDGEGVFFEGSLGHMNFVKPTYRDLKYCMYMWIIPTFGKVQTVEPITLHID